MIFKLNDFSVDRFNNDVNTSIFPDEKYKRWSEYRKDIKEFIAKAIDEKKYGGRAVVFGAGALNDIDLSFLCNAFSQVVLTDVDEKNMINGIARQQLDKSLENIIKTVQIDYSGAEKAGLFKSMEDLAAKAVSAEKTAEYLAETLPDLEPNTDLISELGTFDLIVSCPIYTQIVFSQIESFLRILHDCGLYEYEELNEILNSAYKNMPVIIEKYNDILISCAGDSSVMVLVTDIAEISRENSRLKYVKELLEDQEKNDAKLEEFISENGLELAQIGITDLKRKTTVLNSRYMIWPFNEDKEYLCFALACKKKII